MKEKAPPLYLITGIVIGVLLGLLLAYGLFPVRYTGTTPDTLDASAKDTYRQLVGKAYLYEADSGRAFSRLALLQDADLQAELVKQSQQLAAEGTDTQAARGLALLSAVFTQPNLVITPLVTALPAVTETSALVESVTPTQGPIEATETPVQPSATPFATFTPRPTATALPTQGAPYTLVSDPKEDCSVGAQEGLLIIYVRDANGDGVAGVKIEISQPGGGSSAFYTGLYPEIDNGYADYTMEAGETYNLRVGIGGNLISGLQMPVCSDGGNSHSGSLTLVFKQQ
jgi:hypothetical protein